MHRLMAVFSLLVVSGEMFCSSLMPVVKAQDSIQSTDLETLRRASRAWAEYEQLFLSDVEGNIESRSELVGMGPTTQRIRFLALGGHRRLIEVDRMRIVDPKPIVKCVNGRYAFELIQDVPNVWSLRQLVTEGSPAEQAEAVALNDSSLLWESLLPITTPFISFRNLIDHPGFALVELKEETDGLVRMSFTLNASEDRARILKEGALYLDPQHLWVPRRMELHTNYFDFGQTASLVQMTEIKYAETSQKSFLLPTESRTIVRNQRGQVVSQSLARKEITFRSSKLDPTDFTLTAFGLPDPPTRKSTWTPPWWTAVLVMGLICVMVGIFIMNRRG